MSLLEKLKQLGLTLPPAPKPAGSYVPVVRTGSLLFVSGQLPMRDGTPAYQGKVGGNLTLEEGREAAQLCMLNILSALVGHGVSLATIRRAVKITGYVQSAPDFHDQSKVINAASDLLVEVLGEAGRHSRAAVGAVALPLNAAVEIEAVFEVAD